MKPNNHVDPPDLRGLFPNLNLPAGGQFWSEASKIARWLRYVWDGPDPNVQIVFRNVYQNTQFSSTEIYSAVSDEVHRMKIPGVSCQLVTAKEGGVITAYRTRLKITREFSEYVLCAAPVGTAFFISIRTIDHFPYARWFHYLGLLLLLGVVYRFGSNIGAYGGIVAVVVTCYLIRVAFRFVGLSEDKPVERTLAGIPIIGPIYLRWFCPETFFRQDMHAVFLSLVDSAAKKVIAGLEVSPPLRPDSTVQVDPIRRDLHSSE